MIPIHDVAKLWNKHSTGARMTAADARELSKGAKDRTKGKGKGTQKGSTKGKGDSAPVMTKEEDSRSGKRHAMVFEGNGPGARDTRGESNRDRGRDRDRDRADGRRGAAKEGRSRSRGRRK